MIIDKIDALITQLRDLQDAMKDQPNNTDFQALFDQAFDNVSEVAETVSGHSMDDGKFSKNLIDEDIIVEEDSTQIQNEIVKNALETSPLHSALIIKQNIDGSAQINFQGGGSHHVVGGDGGAVNALLKAYGNRISKIEYFDNLS
jgi:predicted dinucleotide-utilizing enzyme